VLQTDNSGTTLTRVFLTSRREMVAPVELKVTSADGSSRSYRLPVETWLRGSRAMFPIVSATNAKPVRVEIDPRGVYPDADRSNNSWLAPAGP